MSSCSEIRELFTAVLDDEATPAEIDMVTSHTASCAECAGLLEAASMIVGAGHVLDDIEPPGRLSAEIGASPCRRWLGLLFQAVDREISQANLERLLAHLESCRSCRQVWHDLTLIHQVGDAMAPPAHLLDTCVRVREAVAKIVVLPRRTATAAAYVLALLASLAVGNPTIIAEDLHATATQRVSWAASEVSEVAADGRGEARVLLWRAMNWGQNKLDTVRGWIDRLADDDDSTGAGNDDSAGAMAPQGDQS